ncbi:MAG: hypothetical protein NTX22_17845 [Ignavibacteriales bacterium]|nr:hypothetical protein [Ignavibacteriales bacterium]
MKRKYFFILLFVISCSLLAQNKSKSAITDSGWLNEFKLKPENLSSTGANTYFILNPGYQLILSGKEESSEVILTITVLNETKLVDGYESRIVEEKEVKDGMVAEISRNYFAIDKLTNDVYYFGEQVDMYKDVKIINHEGSWESGKDGAKFGLAMPGKIKVGQKYYQEIAPAIAMDRAEIISNKITSKTSAGKFALCLKTEETTPLEKNVKEYKIYAPGIGLIKDGQLVLKKFGYITK